MTKEEKKKHYEQVRNEGIIQALIQKKSKKAVSDDSVEINLEIEEPGAANAVAEEGAMTIQDQSEYQKLVK